MARRRHCGLSTVTVSSGLAGIAGTVTSVRVFPRGADVRLLDGSRHFLPAFEVLEVRRASEVVTLWSMNTNRSDASNEVMP